MDSVRSQYNSVAAFGWIKKGEIKTIYYMLAELKELALAFFANMKRRKIALFTLLANNFEIITT